MILKGSLVHELKKSLRNPWFVLALFLGLGIALWHAFDAVTYALWADGVDHFYVSNQSCFANWIVVDCNVRVASTVFFYVAPFLSALPFAWSFLSERMSGYDCQLSIREKRSDWIKAKGMAAFMSGAATVMLPLLVNLVVIACFLPAYTPQVEESMTVGVLGDCLFSELFYRCPIAYVAAFVLLDGILSGIWAVFVLSLSIVFKNRISLLTIPYLGLLAWQYVTKTAFDASGLVCFSLNMIDEMKGVYYGQAPNLIVIASSLLIMLAISIMLLHFYGKRELV